MKPVKHLALLPEFRKFITASASGRRLMVAGKKVRKGTLVQYWCTYQLLEEYEKTLEEPLRIQLLNRASLQALQKGKNYWTRFFKRFSHYLYQQKKYFDQYVSAVFKIIKTFFRYLALEKGYPVGEFYKKFRIPPEKFTPVILSPGQLKYLITNKEFEQSLPRSLRRTKDIFVFGCTVALRYHDLMNLRKTNLQHTTDTVNVILHTQKTGVEVKVPLPEYAVEIVQKYQRKAGRYVLPRLSGTNLNLQVKQLIKKAGWDYHVPKIRHRMGEAIELKSAAGNTLRFYEHITVHTMRRTAITTLLLMGLDENSVRRISGHSPGSKEFYRYVVVVQDFLNAMVKEAYIRLLRDEEKLILNTTVGYLPDETSPPDYLKDTPMLKRLNDIASFPDEDKKHILYTLDALIKNVKLKEI